MSKATYNTVNKLVVNAVFNEYPTSGNAVFSLIEKYSTTGLE